MSIARYFAKPAKTTTSLPLASTTTFTVTGGYPVGQLDVFLNGVRLVSGDDYTATNGTTFTLASAAITGDVVQYTVYPISPLSYLSSNGGTVTGVVTIGPAANPLTVLSNTNDGLTIDSTGFSPSLVWERSGVIRGYDAVVNTVGDFVPGTAVDDRVCRGVNNFVWGSASTRLASLTSAGVLDLPFGKIKFPAAVSLSADANTLDDYEEGTWTPIFTATTTNPTVTYAATRYGHYTKIGKAVILQGRIGLSATSGGSGNLRISGLPFVPSTGAQGQAGAIGSRSTWTTQGPNNCYVESGLAQIILGFVTATGFTLTTTANLAATSDIIFGAAYMTDA
jgi:hypothetical protein